MAKKPGARARAEFVFFNVTYEDRLATLESSGSRRGPGRRRWWCAWCHRRAGSVRSSEVRHSSPRHQDHQQSRLNQRSCGRVGRRIDAAREPLRSPIILLRETVCIDSVSLVHSVTVNSRRAGARHGQGLPDRQSLPAWLLRPGEHRGRRRPSAHHRRDAEGALRHALSQRPQPAVRAARAVPLVRRRRHDPRLPHRERQRLLQEPLGAHAQVGAREQGGRGPFRHLRQSALHRSAYHRDELDHRQHQHRLARRQASGARGGARALLARSRRA